jgi:hypothetical protein
MFKNTSLTFLTTIILFCFCKTDSSGQLPAMRHDAFSNEASLVPPNSFTYYFPLKRSFEGKINNALDTFSNRWYSKMLFGLKEPILHRYKGKKDIFRFTWLRSFHNPVSTRIEKEKEEVRLIAKVCKGQGGYEPGKLVTDTTLQVSVEEWTHFTTTFENLNFWQMPTENWEDHGKDGSEWILEVVMDNRYHVVTRWTPTSERNARLREVGDYMIALSKLKGDTNYNY